jgi:class 3 adenylate cyclase/tetratricopeptide (TPR) repeat protein
MCGFDNPPGMRFCGNCGTALEALASSTEERKLVTVLFADVVASTQLSGAIDPERLRGQMARFFAIAREEIERYGGTVEKFIGDAVMAVFGLPAIHEDDPERAARAAAAIRSRVRPDVEAGTLPEIRVGISTGEAVANPQATEKGEFLVTGEVVNLAARLQQHADPGQILIGERTRLDLRDVAATRPRTALIVKGRADPLPVWELVDVAPPRERELRATPFVGREAELDLLQGHIRRMRHEERGHVVTILGPAGVGKTRLVREFRARTEGVHILNGRALPYGTGVPFWSLGEAIREECGILFGDPLEVARQKVEDIATQLEAQGAVPALRSVLGLGAEGRDLTREELFTGMRAFFQALAQRSPLLLILEDFHSAEDVTLDYLEHAADWIREVPLLLLILSRPELLERRATWMGGKRSATTLFLDPLAGEESRALVQAILGGKPAPEPLLDQVRARAEGNPLFMEEMLRALIERGTLAEEDSRWALTVPMAEVAIPDGVHAVIAARVDALPPAEKQALQDATLQGKDFFLGALRFVADENHVDESVKALLQKDLVIRKRRSTLAGDEEFTFRHILIRDVAYTMIPKARRWTKHARLAEWMNRMVGDRPAEWADVIAHHWLQVVALRQELGLPPDANAREQAITNLLLAGERAARVYANTTALDHFTRALELEPAPEQRLQALLGRGEVWFLLGQYDQARENFAAVRALAPETGTRRWEAVALDRLGFSFRQQDQIAAALEHQQAALAISREIHDPVLTGHILNHLGFTYFVAERHQDSIAAHEEARALLAAARDEAGLAESLHGLGDNLLFLGRFGASVEVYVESLRLSDGIGNRSLAGENRYMIAFARQKRGEYAQGQPEAERSVAIHDEIGDVRNSSPALMVAALFATVFGDFGKALDYANRGVSLASQIGAVRTRVFNLISLGWVRGELEDHQGALQVHREAADLARHAKGTHLPTALAAVVVDAVSLGHLEEAERYLEEARLALDQSETRLDFPEEVAYAEGRLLLASGHPARAQDAAERLAELAVGETRHWQVPALLLWADAASALGDHPAATARYLEAVEQVEQREQLPALWRALAGLAEVQRALGRSDDTAASARRAREIIERLAATVPDERLRAIFLQSSKVQRVVALAGA